ncbi:MAG TPA: cytochrome b N-terminal domain-containing protein [Bryobacteraceae bacterium]|jgi:ubiquinol-cytochrome c reductase cytochrome b subunit|nr:cytochrome b N-terminal domain-containing protein [Bryobacteraceae bacterium]
MKYLAQLSDWLDHRTGLPTAIRNFLYEEIPASSGWHQVFGSLAMFLFLVQAFTGALLAFNYAPTPGEAYNSLRYILTDLTGGHLMRGLHHWGASMMIVLVVLHMVQVFLYGAYKKPRETTWMVGVVLLLLTLAYGLTGYLLPWDNRAYWGTVVATKIAAQAPLMGPYLTRLLGGEGSIGVVTFARFFGLHVLLLPPATALLIGIHVYLVRKHGVAPAPGDELLPKKKFYPEQVFKDTVAIFIGFVILFTMAVAVRVPLEQLADPTDTAYIPRPEWYFLFLFQTLKLFTGPLEVVGSIVLPGVAVLTLILVPFIDRGQMMRVTKRTFAAAVVVLAALGWTGLTAAAVATTPKEAGEVAVDYSAPTDWMQLSPEEMAGVGYFRQENCKSCHAVGGSGATIGPDLTKTAIHRNAAWMIQHFKSPAGVRPGSSMPPIQLSDPQLNSLAAFLLKLNPDNATALDAAPQFAVDGALVYQKNGCGDCHKVNGAGMDVGPALNGVDKRRSRSWVEEHFLDPPKLSPGSIMPAYKLSQKDLDTLTAYLFSLPS